MRLAGWQLLASAPVPPPHLSLVGTYTRDNSASHAYTHMAACDDALEHSVGQGTPSVTTTVC